MEISKDLLFWLEDYDGYYFNLECWSRHNQAKKFRGWGIYELFYKWGMNPNLYRKNEMFHDDLFKDFLFNFVINKANPNPFVRLRTRFAKMAIKDIKNYCLEVAEANPSGMGKIFKAIAETDKDSGFFRGLLLVLPLLWY